MLFPTLPPYRVWRLRRRERVWAEGFGIGRKGGVETKENVFNSNAVDKWRIIADGVVGDVPRSTKDCKEDNGLETEYF